MSLVRGQRKKVADLTPESKLDVRLRLEGPEASEVVFLALLLGENQEAISGHAAITEDHQKSDCGAIYARPRSGVEQVVELELPRIGASISSVLFTVGLFGKRRGELGRAASIKKGSWTLEAQGKVVAEFTFEGKELAEDAAISVGELYRKDGIWRVRAVGEGFAGGLPALLSRFKLAPSAVAGPGAGTGLRAAPEGVRLPKGWAGNRQPAVPRELTQAVGLVVTKSHEGSVHTGTGFVVGPGGYFITCHHVVHDSAELQIALDGSGVLRPAEVIAMDEGADLALCWMSDRNGAAEWLVIGTPEVNPGLGEELGLLGFPLGVDLGISVTYSQGIINSFRKRGESSVLQIDVGAAPGSSGGPVFRRSDGTVLGVLTSGLDTKDKGMLINFAVDIRSIWRLGWLR